MVGMEETSSNVSCSKTTVRGTDGLDTGAVKREGELQNETVLDIKKLDDDAAKMIVVACHEG